MSTASPLPPSEPVALDSLITPTTPGIASRILGKGWRRQHDLFAFSEGQGLAQHTSPFDAFVMVLDGAVTLTIGGTPVRATPGTIVRLPADVPHAVDAPRGEPHAFDPAEVAGPWLRAAVGRAITAG